MLYIYVSPRQAVFTSHYMEYNRILYNTQVYNRCIYTIKLIYEIRKKLKNKPETNIITFQEIREYLCIFNIK